MYEMHSYIQAYVGGMTFNLSLNVLPVRLLIV